MSAKHTQGPLVLGQHGAIRGGPMVRFINGSAQEQLAMTTGTSWMAPGEHLANARRLVACWNACEGISTVRLERTVNNLHGRASASDKLDELHAQRDELLAALKQCREMVGHPDNVALIEAAIAKAEGGK